jgi:hypothetical protein
MMKGIHAVSDSPESDPLTQLEDWGRDIERQVTRDRKLRRLAKRQTSTGSRRRLRIVAVSVVILAAVAGGLYVIGDKSPKRQAYSTEAVPSGITATSNSTPTPTPSPSASVAHTPFDDTPAATWSSGAGGIATPAAKAIGRWSKADVKADLAKVRSALIASHLDHKMLVQHNPSGFLNLLAPGTRSYADKEFKAGKYGVSLVRITAGTHLSTLAPRVRGRTTYRTTTWSHVPTLEVITNYVWVYPFNETPGGSGPTVVVVHGEEHWYFPLSSRIVTSYRGMTLYSTDGYWDAMDCAQSKKGFTAPASADDGSLQFNSDSESPDDYFQPNHSLTINGDC